MTSTHTDKSRTVALRHGAWAAQVPSEWNYLMALSKRELAEVAFHLAAATTGEYDDALSDGRAFAHLAEEVDSLRINELI